MIYNNHCCFKYALLLLALALPGCDNTDPVISDGTLRTHTPASLRAIPVEQLRADVILSGKRTSYSGADFPDGEWIIDLDVEADRRYVLLISWYLGEHLLMEESGNIITDAANPVIRPDLDFATSGPDRFDTDCDRLPNIFEIEKGSDPGTVSLAPCRLPPPINDPDTLELPWLSRNFTAYTATSGIGDGVTKVEQPVVMVNSESEKQQFYSLILLSDDDIVQADGSLATARATVRLVYDSAGPDAVQFFTRQAISAVPADGNGSVCQGNESEYFCSVPLSLSAGTLYTLALAEVSPFQWQATVTNEATAVTTIVGTMETPSQTSWQHHVVDLGFNQTLTREACSQSLEKISVRFTDTRVNDTVIVPPGAINVSECVQLGLLTKDTAWTGGEKRINETTWYSLTIGN
ncbi:MAG: hypothetical protein AB8B63_08180 [Granulosicoccus sp.]